MEATPYPALMFLKRGGDHDYMMRSEKRPGQRPVSPPPRRKRRKPERHPIYAIITLICLILLYPIGLILLWLRKLRWAGGTKLLVSLATGVIFFVLMAFALTVDVSQYHYLSELQGKVKDSLTYVLDATQATVSNTERISDNLMVKTPKIGLELAKSATRTAADGARMIQGNVRAVLDGAPQMAANLYAKGYDASTGALRQMGVLAPTPEPIVTPEPMASLEPMVTPEQAATASPKPSEAPTPTVSGFVSPSAATPNAATPNVATPNVATPNAATPNVATPNAATPNAATPNAATPNVATPNVMPTPEPRPVPAVVPAMTSAPEALLPTPTLAPTASPTPVPTPSPTPIPLPTIKPLSLSKVYYYDTGKFYHTYPTCSGMKNAPQHTLTEAVAAGKKACKTCTAPDAALMEQARVVFCGEDAIFHVTDECPALTQKWSARTLEEAFIEDGLFGCPLCGSDLYVEAARQKPENTPVPAPVLEN